MKLGINEVIQAINLVSPAPAIVKAIYEQAKPLFDGADQDALKRAYDVAWAGAQRDHADFQNEMKG